MDIVFWNVKGYKGIHLTKEKLYSKEYSFDEIEKSDSNIIKQIETSLENGGAVLALSKKKIIKAIYIFKLTTNDNEKVLIFDKKVVLDEANKCIKEFENDIDTVLNSVLLNRQDVDRTIWREKEMTKNEKVKSLMKGTKILVWFGIIVFSIISLALIICSTSYSFLGTSNYSIEEIKNNESIISYVSNINNYSYSETIDVISEINNNVGFVVVEIIIPTVFTLFGYILLIISQKQILDLIKNVTDSKALFTNDKKQLLNKILLRTDIALFLVLKNFYIWIGIGMILEVIRYLFNYCVQLTNKN